MATETRVGPTAEERAASLWIKLREHVMPYAIWPNPTLAIRALIAVEIAAAMEQARREERDASA